MFHLKLRHPSREGSLITIVRGHSGIAGQTYRKQRRLKGDLGFMIPLRNSYQPSAISHQRHKPTFLLNADI